MAEPHNILVFSVTKGGATLTPVILSWWEGILLPPLGHIGPFFLGDIGPCLIVITGGDASGVLWVEARGVAKTSYDVEDGPTTKKDLGGVRVRSHGFQPTTAC